MNDLKINRDKPDITDDQILKHKNFDAVMKAAKPTVVLKKPWYKTTGGIFATGILGVALIVGTVWMSGSNEETEQISSEPQDQTELPVEEVEEEENISEKLNLRTSSIPVEMAKVAIDLGDQRTIFLNRLSEITFSLRLEKYDDMIFENESNYSGVKIVGISLGEVADLDKVIPFRGNAEIKLDSKEVDVYSYNGSSWELLGLIQEEMNSDVISPATEEKLKPVKSTWPPFVFDEDDYNVSSKLTEFPELEGYANVLFEPVGDFDPIWLDMEWEDFNLARSGDKFELTLLKNEGKIQKKCMVQIVFSEEDYDAAVSTYEASLNPVNEEQLVTSSFYLINKEGEYAICYK